MDRYLETNLKLWNEWTKIHERSAFYDVEGFKKGGVRLRDFEIADVGDVAGKSLLHLQCHFGIDTLSWARLGANVTGIDFSPEAITLARRLAEEIGIDATFVESTVQSLRTNLDGEFDIVYTSRGAIWWLNDLDLWAKTIAHFLAPGGTFYIAEFHPILMTLSEERNLKVKYPYFARTEPLEFPVKFSYADQTTPTVEADREYGWPHPVSEIVSSIAQAGLRIEFFHEFDWIDYRIFDIVDEAPKGQWRLHDGIEGELPLMFSLKATKDERY